jgi:hypothetical protein
MSEPLFPNFFLHEHWPSQRLAVTVQGKSLVVARKPSPRPGREYAKRREITSFSLASRLRMLKFGARVDWAALPRGSFITLTYPDDCWVGDYATRTRQRSQFIRDTETILGKPIYGIWRIEWKIRKSGKCKGQLVQHWHFLIFNVGYIPYREIRLVWERIIGTREHTQIKFKPLATGEHASVYLSKYVGKAESFPMLDYPSYLNKTGRHYGYLRKGMIKLCPEQVFFDLTPEQVKCVVLAGVAYLPWVKVNDPASFVLLGERAEETYQKLREINIDEKKVFAYSHLHQGGARAASENAARRPIAVAAPLFPATRNDAARAL